MKSRFLGTRTSERHQMHTSNICNYLMCMHVSIPHNFVIYPIFVIMVWYTPNAVLGRKTVGASFITGDRTEYRYLTTRTREPLSTVHQNVYDAVNILIHPRNQTAFIM